jgi:MEMO1 family protein
MLRESVVAGQFYPGNPATLRRLIEGYKSLQDSILDAKAVISPHAGYIYSGRVAAAAFHAVRLPKKYLLLGPNHTGRGVPLSLAPGGEWRTPLGAAKIDPIFNEKLLGCCRGLREDSAAHSREHSIEVQLPFLQVYAGEIEFSAICIGTGDYWILETLGLAIAESIRKLGEPVLIVVSSDMNHYESAAVAERKDRLALDRILAMDPQGLHAAIHEHDISMCGYAPAVAAMVASKALGAKAASLVAHTTSGEVSGDYDSVVGYAAVAIY